MINLHLVRNRIMKQLFSKQKRFEELTGLDGYNYFAPRFLMNIYWRPPILKDVESSEEVRTVISSLFHIFVRGRSELHPGKCIMRAEETS